MTMKSAILVLAMAWTAGGGLSAQAEEIARWNSAGSVPLAGTFAPASNHPNVVVSNLVAGDNLLRTGSSPAGNTFAAAGYTAASSNAAMSAGHYWETVIKPNSGFAVSYATVVYRFRSPASGPRWAQWAYSTNGTTFVWLNPVGSNTSSYVDKETSLSAISALQNTTATVWFRMYGWAGGAAKDSWGYFGQNADVLTFSGTMIPLAGPPVVGFTPSSEVQVHVSNVLNVAISVLPMGSGIQQLSVLPTPAGVTNLSGGNFSFTPAAADEGTNFTLTVVATNSYGSTTGTLGIAVTEYLVPGTYEITFDNAGEVKTGYDAGSVTLNGRAWILDQAIIGDSALDLKFGARAARFGKFYEATMTSSNTLLSAGIGTISFWYAQYAAESPAGAELVVEVATNSTTGNWMEVGRVDANGVNSLTKFQTDVSISQPMYVRIRTEYIKDEVGQVNVDGIIVTPYQEPTYTPYEQYLRQYNVTPGDTGTAEGDDWDGDSWTNLQEFNAIPKTNPYDADVHP